MKVAVFTIIFVPFIVFGGQTSIKWSGKMEQPELYPKNIVIDEERLSWEQNDEYFTLNVSELKSKSSKYHVNEIDGYRLIEVRFD